MTIPREYAAHAVLTGRLFLMGGKNDLAGRHSSVEYYDPVAKKWRMVAPMRHARSHATASVSNGFIYILGGLDNEGALQSIEKYDPQDNSWTEVEFYFEMSLNISQ